MGVIYQETRPTYDALFQQQSADAKTKLGTGDLQKLLHAGDTWVVGG
jgi:hypothetical protein